MAKNSKIRMNHTGPCLQLNLAGEFDGSSAMELCHFFEHNLNGAKHVITNTEHLYSIHPFGRRVFQSHFPTLKIHGDRVKFTGRNKTQMCPEKG